MFLMTVQTDKKYDTSRMFERSELRLVFFIPFVYRHKTLKIRESNL